jgi:cysteinyl-tRNA synthetase
MVAAYNKLAKKIAELKKEGDVDTTVFGMYKEKFEDALCNDLNTSMAITVLYDVVKADTNDATKLALIEDFDKVLSLNLYEEGKKLLETPANAGVDAELEAFVLAKIEERAAAKKAKDFATADAIRDELLAKGVAIKDTREGVKWELI